MSNENHLSHPFFTLYDKKGELRKCYQIDETFDLTFNHNRYSKRKGIQSKIPCMSIGDVRQSFVQLRILQPNLTCDTILWNGMSAGKFSLLYIIKTYNTKCRVKKKREKRKYKAVDKAIKHK